MDKVNSSKNAYTKVSLGYDAYFKTLAIFSPWVLLVWSNSLLLGLLFYLLLVFDFLKLKYIFKSNLKKLEGFKKWFWVSLVCSLIITILGYFVILAFKSNPSENGLLGGLMMIALSVFLVSGAIAQNILMESLSEEDNE